MRTMVDFAPDLRRDYFDHMELLPAAAGWDSEMVAYPHVFDHDGERWMLYCGNGFGRTGFGLAIRER